jgi:muramoyltetrapeptide carboxypeptidase
MEDVGERPYAIDRLITHMALAGVLTDVRGAVVGDFVGCEERRMDPEPTAGQVVDERLRAAGIPGVAGGLFGHGSVHRALPMDALCRLDFSGEPTLELLEGAVES